MSKLEEILRFSPEPKQVAKYYNLISNSLMAGETIERIEIEVNLTPKALIITNKRIIECKSKSFGTELEIIFFVFWDSLKGAKVIKGIITDDFEFNIGNSNVSWKSDSYNPSTSMDTIRFILNEIETRNKQKPENTNEQFKSTFSENEKSTDGIEGKLEKLKTLFEKKLISEQDYQEKKNCILLEI